MFSTFLDDVICPLECYEFLLWNGNKKTKITFKTFYSLHAKEKNKTIVSLDLCKKQKKNKAKQKKFRKSRLKLKSLLQEEKA